MDWQPLRDYLAREVVKDMRQPERGTVWLEKLSGCEDGLRLAVCIAIDVWVGSVERQWFTRVLDALPATYSDARAAFAEAAEIWPRGDEMLAASRYGDPPLDTDDRYVRIMSLRSFVTYCLPGRYHTLDRVDEREALQSLPDGKPLGEVEKPWTGRKPVVWVVSERLLDELRASVGGGDEGATAIADALGLFPDPTLDTRDQELIGVRYPDGWAEARLRKPSTFDAWWRDPGHYYLSWPVPEGWGVTWSCSGTGQPLRERVHPALTTGLTDEFTVIRLGLATLSDADTEALMNEAIRRAEKVWSGEPPRDAAAA